MLAFEISTFSNLVGICGRADRASVDRSSSSISSREGRNGILKEIVSNFPGIHLEFSGSFVDIVGLVYICAYRWTIIKRIIMIVEW